MSDKIVETLKEHHLDKILSSQDFAELADDLTVTIIDLPQYQSLRGHLKR